MSEAGTPEARLLHEASSVLPLLADRHPDLALRLGRGLAAHVPLARLLAGLQRLARRRPADVADLLLGSPDSVCLSLDPVAPRLDLPRLQALLERRPGVLAQPHLWFRRLPAPIRPALFSALERHWRDAQGCTSPLIVAWLPGGLRRTEALRNLHLPALAMRPEQRLPYAAFLPWDEALVVLDPWLKHPEGELRGLALQTLAGTVRYERARLGDLLTFLPRKHEQDPVRGRMLAGLAQLPPGAWRAEYLEALGQILRDALSAADLSAVTAGHAERLVVSLLRFHPDWAADWLATLVRERGHIHLGDLQDHLNASDVRRIAPALLPVLRSWQNRERQGQMISFAQSLGRRIPAFDGLADLLEHEVEVSRTQWLAEHTLGLLAQHCKDRLPTLVPHLIKDDPSLGDQAGDLSVPAPSAAGSAHTLPGPASLQGTVQHGPDTLRSPPAAQLLPLDARATIHVPADPARSGLSEQGSTRHADGALRPRTVGGVAGRGRHAFGPPRRRRAAGRTGGRPADAGPA